MPGLKLASRLASCCSKGMSISAFSKSSRVRQGACRLACRFDGGPDLTRTRMVEYLVQLSYRRAAAMYTIVQTAKLDGVNEAYPCDTLAKIADGHPIA